MRMPNAQPLVSAFTPTHNAEGFISETIESVLGQTYANLEHVLIDDASTDGTPAILMRYAQRYPGRIQVRLMQERAGPCRRRNDAIAVARGPMLGWLDHDDVWLPTKIERQMEALDDNPCAAFAYTQWDSFDQLTGSSEISDIETGGTTLSTMFTRGCFFASSTVLFRRAAMRTRGLQLRDAHFSFGDDYFLWLSLLLDWQAVGVGEVLTRIRRHRRNESKRLAQQNFYFLSLQLLDEFVKTFPDAATKLGGARRRGVARHWAAAAEYEFVRGRRLAASAFAARATALDPVGAARYALARARHAPLGVRRRIAMR